MNPPPIGEALAVAWERFKENPWQLMLAVLCANLVFLIPIAGLGLGMAGALLVGTKTARGEVPSTGDAFVGFQRPLDHIMIGLLQLSGMILCCIGACVTAPLFYQGHMLIIEKGMSWQEAMNTCMQEIKPNWLGWTIFWFVLGLFAQLGALACFVGVFVTAPMCAVAQGLAYDRTLGSKIPSR
jgi:hypothetical protein